MPKLPGINHLDAVRAFQNAGYRILRQGKHIIMTDGFRKIVIPRNNPVNAITMGGIVRDAGLSVEAFQGCFEFAEVPASQPIREFSQCLERRNLVSSGSGRWDTRTRGSVSGRSNLVEGSAAS